MGGRPAGAGRTPLASAGGGHAGRRRSRHRGAGRVALDGLASLALALLVLATFTAGTWLAVARGTDAPCPCFGASPAPLGRPHVVRDALLCVAAGAGIACAGAGGARTGGILLALAVGLVIAVLVVHVDDLASCSPGME